MGEKNIERVELYVQLHDYSGNSTLDFQDITLLLLFIT